MTVLVWHDGAIVAPTTPIVTAVDHGVLMGDGVFESFAVRDGCPRLLDRHLHRLRLGLDRIDCTGAPDDDTLRLAVDDLVRASGLVDARVRITVTAGPGPSARVRAGTPTTFITIAPLDPPPVSVSLLPIDWPRNERSPFAGIKSTNWAENAQALRVAASAGFDNALFCDTRGLLSECATANVFLVVGDTIRTPGLDTGCLAGAVRGVLLDGAIAVEAELRMTDLERADAVFITTSTTGITPVHAVGPRPFPVEHAAFDRARHALDAAD